MSDLVEQVLNHVDMWDLTERYGLYSGDKVATFICCPFHQEDTPSARFYEDGLIWCFGCHVMINPISFIERYEDLTFAGAMRWLEKEYSFKFDQDFERKDFVKSEWPPKILEKRQALPFEDYHYLWELYDKGRLNEEIYLNIIRGESYGSQN